MASLLDARHKKILKKAKGYYNARRKVFRAAKQAVIKAGQYAYRDRKAKKRDFRALWITRINAAARVHGLSYSQPDRWPRSSRPRRSTARCWRTSRCTISSAFGVIAEQAKAQSRKPADTRLRNDA